MQTHSDLFHYDRHDQHKSDEPVTTEEIDMSKVCMLALPKLEYNVSHIRVFDS